MNVRQLLAHQHSRKAATEMKTFLLFIKSTILDKNFYGCQTHENGCITVEGFRKYLLDSRNGSWLTSIRTNFSSGKWIIIISFRTRGGWSLKFSYVKMIY